MPSTSIQSHFAKLPDPRVDRQKLHSLDEILMITICGVLCGADNWVSLEEFGWSKESWFRRFLRLPHGIPSHDTLSRVFSMLSPKSFSECFRSWVQSLADVTSGDIVAIDGKTLRRSLDRANGKAAIHMVSAWATRTRLVLGQVKTEEKSNEITAIPKLLELLELTGAIVTIDAMGCQKEIAKAIIDKDADYVLSLKGNHSTLHEEVRDFFTWAQSENFREVQNDTYETVDGEHGRIETRRFVCTSDIDWISAKHEWAGLRSIGMVEATREQNGIISREIRYFLSSLPGDDAKTFARAVREHWAVENQLHWVLDVAFREDENRTRTGNAAENFATVRHIALNLLKQEKSKKLGIANKRLKAAWDEAYLLKVLGF